MTGYRRLTVLATAAATGAAVLLSAVASSVPVQAVATPSAPAVAPLQVLGMGDSYTAGVGGSAALTGADAACRRTSTGYASVVAGALRQSLSTAADLQLVACSGATTLSTRTGSDTGPGLSGAPRSITGPDQPAAVDADTDLVVLTAGAGDTDFEAILAACLLGGVQVCTDAGAAGVALYDPARLVQLLAAVDSAAGARSPQDRLVVRVSGYVQPYDVDGVAAGACTSALSPATAPSAAAINAGVVALNGAVAAATAQAAAAAANSVIDFVEVDSRFVGHRLCTPEPWLVEPTLSTVAGRSALHPTDAGHAAYAAAVLSQPGELAPLLAARLVPAPTSPPSATTTPATTPVTTPATTTSGTATTTTTGATTGAGTGGTSTGTATTSAALGGVALSVTTTAPVGVTRGSSTVAAAPTRGARALPTTGAAPAPLLLLAAGLVLAGAAATGLSRRRSRPGRAG